MPQEIIRKKLFILEGIKNYRMTSDDLVPLYITIAAECKGKATIDDILQEIRKLDQNDPYKYVLQKQYLKIQDAHNKMREEIDVLYDMSISPEDYMEEKR
jgi:hypothetical protein